MAWRVILPDEAARPTYEVFDGRLYKRKVRNGAKMSETTMSEAAESLSKEMHAMQPRC